MNKLWNECIGCCSSLASTKITERKHAACRLQNILKDSNEVVCALDEQSAKKSRSRDESLNWDYIIDQMKRYVILEVDGVKVGEETLEKNRRKYQDCSQLYQFIISKADKRGPLLKSGPIYSHILDIFFKVDRSNCIVVTYTNILMKCLLSKRKHASEIGVKKWHEFVGFYFSVLVESGDRTRGTQIPYARCLQQLLLLSSTMPYLHIDEILNNFNEVFKNVRQEKNHVFLELILSGCVSFCWATATDARTQICELGETNFNLFLQFWKYQIPTIKVQLVNFFQLQVFTHFALNTTEISNSTYPWINITWKTCLKEIFQLIYSEFLQLNGKMQKTSSKSMFTRSEMIQFVASVIHQIYLYTSDQLDITISCTINSTYNKKSKVNLQSVWTLLIEGLKDMSEPKACIAWLDVVYCLFSENHLNISSEDQIQEVMNVLVETLSETSREDVSTSVVKTLLRLLNNLSAKLKSLPGMQDIVKQIWRLSIKQLEQSNYKDLYFELMYSCWKTGLISSTYDIFKLFDTQKCPRTYYAMQLLSCILQTTTFPRCSKSIEQLNRPVNSSLDDHQLRKQLISWLLPQESKEVLEPFMYKKTAANIKVNELELLCFLLTSLMCVSPSNLKANIPVKKNNSNSSCGLSYKEMQKENLITLHALSTVTTGKNDEKMDSHSDSNLKYKCLKEAEMYFARQIEGILIDVLKNNERDLHVCTVELLAFVILLKEKLHSFTLSEVLQNYLEECINKLVKKAVEVLEELISAEIDTSTKMKIIMSYLKCLNTLVVSQSANQVTHHLPEGMIELLIQITEGDFITLLHTTQHKTMDQLNFSVYDDMELDSEPCEEVSKTTSKGNSHPLDEENLNEVETVKLSAFKIVVRLLLLNPDKYSLQRRNFFQVFIEHGKDDNAKLQMLVELNTMVEQEKFLITPSELFILVDCARRYLSANRFDMDVCCAILVGIVTYIKQIVLLNEEENNAESKMTVLKLIEVFWSLRNDKFSPLVRIGLSNALIALSQINDPDIDWKLPLINKADGTETLVFASNFLVEMLYDKNVLVRCHIADHLDCLFTDRDADHVKLFGLVVNALDHLINLNSLFLTKNDRFYSNEITVLKSLKKLICSCTVLERKGVWLLFHFTITQVLKEEHVFKVLGDIACIFGYGAVHELLTPRIVYLIFTFVLKKNPIETFPSGCLGLSITEFLRNYYQYIVPCYVLRNNFEAIEKLGNHLGFNYDVRRLLMDSFELTVVHTLPIYCGYIAGGEIDEKKALIVNGSQKFREQIGDEIYGLELEKRFDAIVFQVILRLHDPQEAQLDLSRFTLTTDSSPYYPTFTSAQITVSLSQLATGFGKDTTISPFLKFPDSIPSILSNLALQVTSSKRSSEKLTPIKSYYYFTMFLLDDLHHIENYGGDFIIREITYRLLYFIDENSEESCDDNNSRIVSICFEILEGLCERISVHLYVTKELSKHVCFIVSKLTSYTLKEACRYQALRVLQCLIIDSTQNDDYLEYINAVAMLDEFPHEADFTSLNDSLLAIKRDKPVKGFEEELKRIASNFQKLNRSVPKSLLQNLKKLLAEKAKSIVVSEPLNEIVFCLLRVCGKGDDESRLLAIDCLGLIGPIPISGFKAGCQLQSSELPNRLFSACPLKFYVVVEAILLLCIHECSLVSKTAWDCLSRLIRWEAAKSLILTYKELDFFNYIQPYLAKKKKVDKSLQSLSISVDPSFEKLANSIMYDKEKGFDTPTQCEDWLKNLVSALLVSAPVDEELFLVLKPLCELHVEFARLTLTFVVHNIIISHDENKVILSNACQSWLDTFLVADEETKIKKDMRKKVIEVIYLVTRLRSIDFTSTASKSSGVTCWNNNFWLDIDYLQLAKAAHACGQYYNAAMFIEIWSDPLRLSENANLNETKDYQPSSTIFNCSTTEAQTLLYQIYSDIGDVDAIYGVDTNTSMQMQKRLQLLQCEKEFHKALLSSDLSCSSMKCNSDVLQTLMQSGLYHTSLMYMNSVSDEELEKCSEIQFEAAWRNGLWNTTQLRKGCSSEFGFHESLYQGFLSLEDHEGEQFKKHLRDSKLSIVKSIQSESISSKTLYDILSRCYTSSSLEIAAECIMRKTMDGLVCPSSLLNDFTYYEPSLSAVSQAIKIERKNMLKEKEHQLLELSSKLLISHCKLARESQRFEVAENFISMLQNDLTSGAVEWKLEEAKVYWDRKETNHAMHVLRQLMTNLKIDTSDNSHLYPVVLGLYGHWLGETKSQNPVHIMEKYLEPAITMMEEESFSGYHSPIDAYHSLAKYADVQYQSLRDYIKSPLFQTKQTVIKRNQDDMKKFNADGKKQNTDKMVEIHFKMLEKQCIEDETELNQTLRDHQTFLEKAVQNYCKCLQFGDKYNLKVLRLCSLWFEHFSEDFVNYQTKVGFSKIKASKFLPVMYQLAARLGTNMALQCSAFKDILESVIQRCCIDHPHHSIFILLALCNADYEETLNVKSKKRQSKGASKNTAGESDKGRINAAKSILARIRSSKAHLVQDAERLANAYIELAYWDISHLKNEKGSFMISETKSILKIRSLSSIAIPTVETEIDHTCEYENVTHIHKFEPSFSHAGGVNLPKIINCIGSDGERRKQLIKGRDDLRQDAVMQQVFGVVNKLLNADPETRQRDLRMRTYKIVPLSRKSGLMEWCEGTVPLGNYLVGSRDGSMIGAHTRYYPKDWSIKECRTRLASGTNTEGKRSKLKVYQEIQKHFHPVFRHFFYEKFRDPADWFVKRLGYTRSTAVCSIVGYILGLGDRHCQNILIDCNTAEVVHIDLGVAFEKGKLLPTPETIPFRLTRDIIDGMGINGIEGVFRRCCETTMGVMRNSHEGIVTIVEVLLYDPLSDWTITSEKLKKLQKVGGGRDSEDSGDDVAASNGITQNSCSEIDTDRNKMAERVLMRLKQKLAGSEGGAFLGLQGHVNYLIQEACNPQNLCRLFPGWQPWL